MRADRLVGRGAPLTLIETNYYLHKSARDAYRSYMLAYHSRRGPSLGEEGCGLGVWR